MVLTLEGALESLAGHVKTHGRVFDSGGPGQA